MGTIIQIFFASKVETRHKSSANDRIRSVESVSFGGLIADLTRAKFLVGVDLGGTWIRAALADRDANILEKSREAVNVSDSTAIGRQIVRSVLFLCKRRHIEPKSMIGVGVASAGPLIMKQGVLIRPTNLPFEKVLITEPVSRELGVPCFLINDCSGAALAERRFGAAKGIENFVYVTISTGIGAGAIVNDTLLHGKDGNSHEVGHFTIDYTGRLICGCGRRGHWEAYCSGKNIPNFVRMRYEETDPETTKKSLLSRKNLSKLTAADLFAHAKAGDSLATQLVEEIGALNAIGFGNVVSAYDPALITVGGTVVLRNSDAVLTPIKKSLPEHSSSRPPKIAVTSLGEDAVTYGAIASVLESVT